MFNKIKIGNLEIHYHVHKNSDKAKVLLIHGLGCSLHYWDLLFESEIANQFELWAIDLVGFGESSKPKDFDYSMHSQAKIVKQFIEHFQLDFHAIVGFSMGGPISVLLADKMDNLEKLILIEPVLIGSDVTFSRKTAKMPYWTVSILKFLARLFPKIFGKQFLLKPNQRTVHIVLEAFLQTSNRAFVRASKELVKIADSQEAYEKLEKLQIERHYILGSVLEQSDHFAPPKGLFKICKKHVVPESEHPVMLDNPQEFEKIMSEILISSSN